MGGYGQLNDIDVRDSKLFLDKLISKQILDLKNKTNLTRALDCGAGIGRITEQILVNYFDEIDLLEQNDLLLEEAKRRLNNKNKIKNYFLSGIQDYQFSNQDLIQENSIEKQKEIIDANKYPNKLNQNKIILNEEIQSTSNENESQSLINQINNNLVGNQLQYDCIWIQWVSNQIDDENLIQFLKKCKKNIKSKEGVIILKENVSDKNLEFDFSDYSATRNLEQYKQIFQQARLEIKLWTKQKDFPEDLYDIYIFALK